MPQYRRYRNSPQYKLKQACKSFTYWTENYFANCQGTVKLQGKPLTIEAIEKAAATIGVDYAHKPATTVLAIHHHRLPIAVVHIDPIDRIGPLDEYKDLKAIIEEICLALNVPPSVLSTPMNVTDKNDNNADKRTGKPD